MWRYIFFLFTINRSVLTNEKFIVLISLERKDNKMWTPQNQYNFKYKYKNDISFSFTKQWPVNKVTMLTTTKNAVVFWSTLL